MGTPHEPHPDATARLKMLAEMHERQRQARTADTAAANKSRELPTANAKSGQEGSTAKS